TLHTQRLGRLFFAAATFVLLVAGALIGAPAAAADTAISETTAFTYTADNLCTGEVISGTGNMHFLLHENLSANGAIEHYLDVHIDGLKAIGMPNGKTYIAQDVYSDEFVIAGATEETLDITAHFIRQGAVGTKHEYLTIGTYPTKNALAAVRAIAKRLRATPLTLSGGGLAVQDTKHPSSVYFAYPGSDYQVEVFDPSPARARSLALSGRV